MRPFLPSYLTVTLLAFCTALVGCQTTSRSQKVDPPPAPLAVQQKQDDAGKAQNYPNVDRQAAETLAAALQAKPTLTPASGIIPAGGEIAPPKASSPPRAWNILVVSGGGQYGAFGAGMMCGWTAMGTRPEFDVICGVSSGAMIASIAFLGPKWDPLLKKVFTTTKTSDLIRERPIYSLLYYQSLGDSTPARKLIEREVTADFIADMKTEHLKGRRCFVGTLNQNTRRHVIWDLGAIASSDRPDAGDMVRKILLASIAIPGIMPAVEFDVEVNGTRYQEVHVDGGAVCQTFVRLPPYAPQPDPENPSKPWMAGSNVYVIAGGKVYCDPIEGKPGFLKRTKSAISATLYALYRADLWRTYTLCTASGMKFQHASIPDWVTTPPNSMEFDPKAMKELFDFGYDIIQCGEIWKTTLPGTEPGDEELPRAGFQFTLPK
jgi:Patatin-like phospholipase